MAEETTPIDPQSLSGSTPEDIASSLVGRPSVVEEEETSTPTPNNDIIEVSNQSLRNMMYRDGDGNVDLYNANDGRADYDFDQFSDKSLLGVRTTKKLDSGSTFTGYQDTYNRSEEAQGVVGKLSNTLLGFAADTGINVAQGTAGMLYGAGSAIANGDLTKIYDNTLSNALDRAQEGFNEQFEVTRGGNQGLVKKGVNLVDDLAGALSFVAGAVITEIGLSAATAATGGAAAPVQAAATAGIVARGSRMLKQMASGGRRFIGKSAVDDALKGAAKLGDDATRVTAGAALGQAGAAIDKASKLSSLARVSRQLLTGAGMEAGMEARHMLNEATEERAREYEKEYGTPMVQEMKDAFREENSKYGDAVFAANLALVGVGNMLMFPKLFGLGMKRGMNVERFMRKSSVTSAKQQKRIAKAYGKKWDELPDILDVQRARRVAYSGDILNPLGGRMGRATARSRSALYEGFVEEGGQGTISRSTKDFIAQKYDPDNRDKVVKYTDSFVDGLKGAYGTAEGLKEISLGVVIGYMGLPNVLIGNMYSEGVDADGKKIKPRFIGGASEVRRQQLERDKQVDRILQLHKENGEVGAVMRAEIDHAVRMQGLEKQHKEAAEDGDLKVLKDVEGDSIFSFASSKIVTGRFDDAIAEYKGIMEEQTPEEFRAMLAESDGVHVANMSEDEILDAKTRATQRYVERMGMVKQAYEASESIYQGEDPEIHTALAHMLYNLNDKDSREKALAESLAKELRSLTGAEVLDATKVMTAYNVDEKTLNKAIKSQRRLKAIDKQLETKRAAGQISNVNEEKSKVRTEEIEKLEEERGRILREREDLEQALSGEYGFDLDKAQQRVESLFRLNEALIESGEEVGSFAKNGLDKDTVLDDLLRVSLDRLALIRGYNMLLEPGGYDRFVASLSGGIQAQLKEDPVAVAEENEAKRTHEEADETVSRDESYDDEDVTRAQAAEGTDTKEQGTQDDEEDNTDVTERVDEEDDSFIPQDPDANRDEDEDVEVGVGEEEDVTRAQAAKKAKKTKAKETTNGRIEIVVEGIKLDASETAENGEPNPKREGAAQAIRDNIKEGDTIGIRMSGGFVYYMYKGLDIHSVDANNVPLELRAALEGGVELEARIKQATQFAGTRTRDKNGDQISVSVSDGLTSFNGASQLNAIEDIVLEFDSSQNGTGPGKRNSILTGDSVTATRKNARGTAGSKTRHYIVVKDANGNKVAFDIAGKQIGSKVAGAMIRMYELALVADGFSTAADIGLTEAQYDGAWASLSTAFGFNENEKAKYQVDSVFNRLVAPVRKDEVVTRPRIKYLPAVDGKPPAIFIESVDDKGQKKKPMKYTPKNAKAFLAQLSQVQYAVQLPQMDFDQLPLSMEVNENGSIKVDFTSKKEWYGRNMKLAGHRPIMIDSKPYVELLHEMVLETNVQVVPAAPEQNVEETIDGKTQTDITDDVSDDEFADSDDDFSIVLDEDEEDLLKRASDLYSIEGFTVRRVQDTVNVLAGKIAQQLLAQSRSKGRSSQRSASSIKGELQKNLKAYQAKLQTKVGNESISEGQRKVSKARLDHVTKMLEPKTFDQFVELAFHEVLRQADGVVNVNSKALVRSIDQIEANQELSRKANEKRAGEEGGATVDTEDAEAAVENEPSALAAFDDNFAFGTDPGKTMRFELRLAMMGLRHRESTPATTGVLGKKFLDFKTLQASLQPMFVGVEPSWDAIHKVLQDRAEQMPVIQDILDMLEVEGKSGKDLDYRKMMRQQFVVWAHKEDGSHVTIKLTPYKAAPADSDQGDTPGIIYQFDSNEINMDKFVVRIALQNMLNRNFFKLKEGETILNRSVIEGVLAEMDRIAEKSNNKAIDTAKLMYKHFGLQVPVEALNDANEDFTGIEGDMANKEFVNSSYGKFRRQLRLFADSKGDVEATGWYGTAENQKSIEGFFGAAAKHQQNLIQMVSRDADGKLRYHYHAPKLLTVQLHNLRRGDLSAFDKGNPLVNAVRDKRNQSAEHKVRIDYVNGIKNNQQTGESRKFHDMEEPDQIIARMSFMGNDNALDARKRPLSRHMLPTLADKSTMPLIRVQSMSAGLMKAVNSTGLNKIPVAEIPVGDLIDVKGYYTEQLQYAVEKELDMIQSQRVNGVDAKFVLFPELNTLLPEGMITTKKRTVLHAKAAAKIEAELQTDFTYVMQQLENEAYDSNETGGIGKVKFFNKNNTAFVKTHIGEQNADVSVQAGLLLFAAKYVAESRAVNAQSMLAFAGSTEAFLKIDNGAINTGKTIDNIGKRLAGLIAPGNAIPLMTLPNGKSNESINILVLQDKKHEAEHLKYLRKIGVPENEIKDKYTGIEAADAAEYVTAEEHLGILLAQGKMSEEEYNGILPKVKAGVKLDVEELSWFQPMKPVNVERGANGVMNYIKSAQFPLLPEFTEGTELDKLRKLMEEKGIDRAIHKTAYKVGSHNMPGINIYAEDGKIEIPEDIMEGQAVLSRRGMRIQQEVPVSRSKEKVHGSQVAKLVMANIAREDITGFTVNGVEMNGKQAHEHYLAARKEERMVRRQIFADKYGYDVVNSGGNVTIQYNDTVKSKLAERIIEEAQSRGYEVAEISHLRLDLKKNRFRTPLWASISEERVNSLLQAIYRKEVIESKIAGFAGPIAPAVGISYGDISDMKKSGIVWVGDKFDGKKLRVGVEGKPDQILMPWKFKGQLEKFVDKKTGKLDMAKVPEELLQVFAYRIPNQKKASSGSFEIVGFLPASMGDTLIVPDELVGRIGQDFDIDKMFGMMYTHRFDKKAGKLSIVREGDELQDQLAAARNRQIDVYHASMRNPNEAVQKEIHTPVSNGYSGTLAFHLQGTNARMSPLSIRHNVRAALGASSAKSAIGVMANANVVHTQMEMVNANVHYMKTYESKKGQIVTSEQVVRIADNLEVEGPELSDLAKLGKRDILDTNFLLEYPGGVEAGTVQDQFSRLLNHAVDNANDQLLGKLGIDKYTYSFWVHLTNMGYNMETISMMVRQPEVLEVIESQRRFSAVSNNEYFDLGEELDGRIEIAREDYLTTYGEDAEVKGTMAKTVLASRAGIRDMKVDPQVEAQHQIKVLEAFRTLADVDSAYHTLLPAMKMDTQSPKNRGEFFFKVERARVYKEYHQERGDEDYEGPRYAITFDTNGSKTGGALFLDSFISSSVSGMAFQDARETNKAVLQLPGEHLESTQFGKSLIEAEGKLSREFQTEYFKGLRSFLAAEWVEKRTGKSARTLRRELVVDQETSMARKYTTIMQNHSELRNNLFLKHLQAFDLTPNKEGLHTVEFQGDRTINVSPEQLHSAFLALARHDNAAVREFATDLVHYDLVMRGTLGSKSFGKYIPGEMLQMMGIQEQYDPNQSRFQESMNEGKNKKMHRQIIQHNPKIAPVVEVTKPSDYRDYVDQVKFKSTYKNLSVGYVRDNRGYLYVIEGEPEPSGIATARRVAKAEKTYLYNLYSSQEELDNSHEFSDHYKDNKIPQPAAEEEMPAGEAEVVSEEPTPVVAETEPTVKPEKVAQKPLEGSMSFDEAVAAMGGENNVLLQRLMLMNEKLPAASKVQVVFREGGNHKYNAGVITINSNAATADRLAHEMIHHMSRIGVNMPQNKENRARLSKVFEQVTKDSALASRFGMSLSGISRLQRGYRLLQAQKGDLSGVEPDSRDDMDINNMVRVLQRDPATRGLLNLEEFIAESMTNPEFAAVLNEIKVSPNKTLLERVYEIISDIINTLNTQVLGDPIELSKDSALAEVSAAAYAMMETTAEGLSNIKEKGAGSQMELFSVVIPEGVEDEVLKATDAEVLKQYKKRRIAEFEELRARFGESPKVVADINKRILQERMELMKLEDKDDDSVNAMILVDMAQRELEDVDEVVRNVRKATTRDSRHAYAHARLQNAQAVIDFYSKGRKLLDTKGLTRGQIGRLQGVASQLQDDWMDVSAEILQNYARARYKGTELEKLIEGDTFRNMKDIGALNSLFLDASRVGRVELSYLDGVVRDAAQAQRSEWVARNDVFQEKSAAFKESAFFEKYGWSGMVKGTAENQTNELIGPISREWDMEMKQRRDEAFRSKKHGPFKAWLKKNTVKVNMRLYDLDGDTAVRRKDPKIELELEKKLGKGAARELMLQQDRLAQLYLDNRRAAFDMIEVNNPAVKHPKLKAEWVKKNGFANEYSEYTYRMPARFVEGKETKWHDSRFNEMQKEPAAMEFYTMYREQMREMTATLPRHEMTSKQIALMEQGLFIPAVQRSLTDQWWKRGNRREELTEAMYSSLTTKIEDSLAKSIDPVTGEVRRNLPTYFVQEVKNKAQMEYDLDKNFAAFSMMATTYKHKNLVEDEVRMIEAVLGEVGITHQNGMGQKILNKAGAVMSSNTQSARGNVGRSVRAVMDGFYGRRSNIEGKVLFGTKKARTESEKNREASIKRGLEQLEEDRRTGAVPKRLYEEQKAQLEEDLSNVGSKYDAAKVIRTFVQYMQMKGMAWNIPAAQVNAVFGTMQVMKHAAGRRDFDESDARKAFGIMMHSTMNMVTLNTGATKTATAGKLQGLMTNLNLLKDFTEIEFDTSKADVLGNNKKGISKLGMYEIQRSSEYFTYGHTMVSHLLNVKVDGVSLFEATDENGIIQLEGYRPGEAKFVELANRLDQINKRIHGNYDPNSVMPIKQTLLGPMLMQFRSWLPEGFATRYESEKFDPLLNRQVKGSIRTVLGEGSLSERLRKMTDVALLSVPLIGARKDLQGYTEIDEENVRKFAASVRQMMWVYLLILALRSMKDDEDDEEVRQLFNYGLNLSSRIDNDLKFFGQIGAQRRIVQDILPITKVAEDIERFGASVIDTMMGEGTIPTGVYAGESKLWLRGSKLVPHTEAYQRIIRNLSQEMK